MPIPRRKSDELLKGVTEENLPDLLTFLYPDAAALFDLERGVTLRDKELHAIIPDRERKNDSREADLLFQVWLQDGCQQFILINIELEGGNDPFFERRAYEYNYRIRDRFGLPVATIVIYTGNKNQRRPTEYRENVLDTELHFRYRAYHIFDHTIEELLGMGNIFALVVAASQKSLLEGKIPEEELGEDRLTIAKALLAHGGYDNERIISFLVFLKNYLFVGNQEINSNFENIIHTITENRIDMGVIDTVKRWEREQGKAEGKMEGILEGKLEEKELLVRNLITKTDLSDHQIAEVAEVGLSFVEKIRAEI